MSIKSDVELHISGIDIKFSSCTLSLSAKLDMTPEFGKRNDIYLQILQDGIVEQVKRFLDLQSQLDLTHDRVGNLIQYYRQERYTRQESLWKERCLTRCTLCFNIPPSKTVPANTISGLPLLGEVGV